MSVVRSPSWVNGSWILPTVAQFGIGGRNFTGVLDGFGKLNRFELANQQVCFRSQMMQTAFYKNSQQMGTVAPGMLFNETIPPRKCPPGKTIPSCNVKAPNDNTYVNTFKLGDHYTTWTDSPVLNEIDPHSIQVTGKFNWTDQIGHPRHLGVLGAAHPVRRLNGAKELVLLQIDTPILPDILQQGAYVDVAQVDDRNPHQRELIHTSKKQQRTPYFHSFGLTEDYVVRNPLNCIT